MGEPVGLVGHEQHLVADRLHDAAAVRGDDLQRPGLEGVDELGQLRAGQRPALPGVVDDVGETDANDLGALLDLGRLVGLGVVTLGGQQQP